MFNPLGSALELTEVTQSLVVALIKLNAKSEETGLIAVSRTSQQCEKFRLHFNSQNNLYCHINSA